MNDALHSLIDNWPAALASLILLLGLMYWLVRGRTPRIQRALWRGRRWLRCNQWREALAQVEALGDVTPFSLSQRTQIEQFTGECHRQAGAAALAAQQYEEGDRHLREASKRLHLSSDDAREYVVNIMLGEIRRLYAASATRDALALSSRALKLEPSCAEAMFWQAMALLSDGQAERAQQVLAAFPPEQPFLDPPFYLGMLSLRAGAATEAVRWLSAAHRLDSGSAFVDWQLGRAMLEAGSDPALAVRALQSAVKGLLRWQKHPQRAWVESAGADRSYVQRLAAQHPFTCPLLGSDTGEMLRQAQLSLAQAQLRLGQYAAAAELCRQLLGQAPPSLVVLRTLGLALAQLNQFDEAFKYLRAAFDLEEPKQPRTAGYLALCGALGKPARPDDKISNVVWAIGLLRQFTMPADAEWAEIHARVLAEARSMGVAPAVDDLRCAADVLAAVEATDPLAAAVYDDLAVHGPDQLLPQHTWLYGRAVQQRGVRGQKDLELLAVIFREAEAARDFFEQRSWDFKAVECLYLIRWAEVHPASFPAELGEAAPQRVSQLLLPRSHQQEQAGQLADALATAAALAALLPFSAAALDRWACLCYRTGDVEQAVSVLEAWQTRHPRDVRPYLRLAILEQQRGNRLARTLALQQALSLAKGPARARAAWLGAQLALASAEGQPAASSTPVKPEATNEAIHFLQECLKEQPYHAQALTCLAALHWRMGDRGALAALAPVMRQASGDAGFHYLFAICHLQADDADAALTSAQSAAAEPALVQEARFLMARAYLAKGDPAGAAPHLRMVATDPDCLSFEQARAALGCSAFQAGDYDHASYWWQQIATSQRVAWRLEPVYQASVLLAGLTAYRQCRYEESAQRFREAGRLGWRHRELGLLLQLALFKAGQQLLQPSNHDDSIHLAEKAAGLLEKCLQAGCKDPQANYLLAVACQRQGKIREARDALNKIADPDTEVFLQRGLLALQDRQLADAEQAFADACALDPLHGPASYNLLMTRLSLGRLEDAGAMLPSYLDQTAERHRDGLSNLVPLLGGNGSDVLASLGRAEEEHLLQLIRSLGNLDVAIQLLDRLQRARPDSATVREACFETTLLAARQQLQRGDNRQAQDMLTPWSRQREALRTPRAVLHNLLGCCACLNQDFASGINHFTAALRLNDIEPRLHQNRALALEWSGDSSRAEAAWLRFLEHIDAIEDSPPELPDYPRRLAIDALLRLAGIHADRGNHATALPLVERAHQLQPDHTAVLDRLFQLYRQLERSDLARRTLQRLRQLRPDDPNVELYELELQPLRRADELERWLDELERILRRYPRNRRVQERSAVMLGSYLDRIKDFTRQGTEQFHRAVRQIRSLRHDEVNWGAVQRAMRDLRQEFGLLRQAVGRVLAANCHGEHQRQIAELSENLDRKIDETTRWQAQGSAR